MTIIKKFDPVEPQKNFSKRYIVFIVLGFLLLTVIEIWVNNTVVTYGEKFESMSFLQKNLSMENQILETEIAHKASLQSIASKSAELGFSKVESIQYIR